LIAGTNSITRKILSLKKRLNKVSKIIYILILFVYILAFSSCSTVKPYQRVFLNDPEMQMGSNSGKAFENYVLNIREGSIVPGSKKASGGCGCN